MIQETASKAPAALSVSAVEAIQTSNQGSLAEARARFPLNIVSNVLWLGLNMLVNVWYTPYLIGNLGVAVYGLIPLVNSMTNYMTIITQGFNSGVSRFLTLDLASEDPEAANQTFNTTLFGSLIIIAILLPVTLALTYLAPYIFDVPVGHTMGLRWLVLMTSLTLMLTTFASSFTTSSYAQHRFDLRLLLNIARLALQVGIVVMFFTLEEPQLWHVGLGMVASGFIFLAGHQRLWRKLTPELRIAPRLFEKSRLGEIFGFSGWVLVSRIGSLLFLNIDLIVANLVFGAEVAGRYGSVILFPTLLRTLVNTIDGVLTPIMLTLYAQRNYRGLVKVAQKSVKFTGLLIALPIGLLCGLARPLLSIWLGPDFADLSWLVIALVSHLCINTAVIPLFAIQIATNKVRLPGLVTVTTGIVNALFAYSLARWSNWGYVSIAIAGAIVLTAKNALFTPLYSAKILKASWRTFIPYMLTSVVGMVIVSITSYWISQRFCVDSWLELALIAISISILYGISIYTFMLSQEERAFLLSEVRSRLKL